MHNTYVYIATMAAGVTGILGLAAVLSAGSATTTMVLFVLSNISLLVTLCFAVIGAVTYGKNLEDTDETK